MATMEKTWQFDTSRAMANQGTVLACGSYILWYIKAFLTGTLPSGNPASGLWSVYYSCDSVTAGTANDGVDRWSDASKVVQANGASAHSWCVLKSPAIGGVNYYLCLNANRAAVGSTGSSDSCCAITASKTAPTGGSTTVGPGITADSVPGFANTTYGSVQLTDTATNHHLHGGLTTDGSVLYVFASKDGTGTAAFGLIFSILADTRASDAYPYVLVQRFSTAARGGLDNTCWQVSMGGAVTTYPQLQMRTRDGTGSYVAVPILPNVGTTYLGTFSNVSGPDSADGSFPAFPLWLGYVGATSTGVGVRGRIPDFAFTSASVAGFSQGSTDSPGGAVTSVLLGDLWVPMGQSPVL